MGPKATVDPAEEEARLAEEAAKAAEEERQRAMAERLGATLCFKDLSEEMTTKVLDCTDPDELLSITGAEFNIHDFRENIRSAILIDFYVGNLLFAKESGMNAEQCSAFFAIMKRAHEASIEQTPPMEKSFEWFKSSLLKHCLKNPPEYVDIFFPEQVELITSFASRTYFQHYGLYQYAFTHEQEKDRYTTKLFVQTVMAPPPLCTTTTTEEVSQDVAPVEPVASEDITKQDDATATEVAAPEEGEKGAEYTTADGTPIPPEVIEKMVNAALVKRIEELKADLAKSMQDQNEQVLERIKRLGT
jgi:hypothetical protein